LTDKEVISITKRWIEQFIIDYNICPFAAYPYRNELIKYSVSRNTEREHQLYDLFQLFIAMVSADSDQLSNSFIIYPEDQAGFDDFYEMNYLAEALLQESGYYKDLQIVIFHPKFRYEDELPSDPSNMTNRSPFPMIHVLRIDEVAQALESYEESQSIPEKNRMKLQSLDKEQIYVISKLIILDR
jgi:hypothetical protein